MTATEAVMYLAAGEVSPTELLEAALTRHQEVDGAINARLPGPECTWHGI